MKKVLQIILVLTFTAVVSGFVLSSVNNWAKPLIEENRIKAISQAIFLVQQNGVRYEKLKIDEIDVFEVFDENNNSIGYAVVSEGNGFQGTIKLIFGIDKDLNRIKAIEILEQVETPGLGSLITEDNFKNRFKNLNTQPLIQVVKGKKPSNDNEVQAITGATISSKAVVRIVNDAISKLKKFNGIQK
ncbi:MAG: FMN-binding protein [Ignavibacteria bacterium]|jgi:electron transport complex protein RnfG|nr:FMN-binding protein [Ignavibacteria bacterium]MDH7526597.1 FMN-binding protein [Ignavibacteria bacterium]